jgi:heme exporter protein A
MPAPLPVSLEAHKIACERGGRRLFEDLSFRLGPGEALLVSGPNGAGKTSLLRQIAGLLPLTDGRLVATGADADTPLAELCHYVGHLNGAKSALTVRENLSFWAEYLGEGEGDLAAALDVFGLAPLAELPAGLLSAGQKRKLALSRLFTVQRPIWLLDEPSVSLDAAAVKRLDQAIRGHLNAGGIAIVATHVPLKTKFTHTLGLGLERAA